MPIDAINTAMTPLQFSRAMGRARTVETADASLDRQSPGSQEPLPASPSKRGRESSPLAPFKLHFTYAPIPGKLAVQRRPQGTDPSYWSRSLNSLG